MVRGRNVTGKDVPYMIMKGNCARHDAHIQNGGLDASFMCEHLGRW